MARKPKILTFDVVGTLIDFEGGMKNALGKLLGPKKETLDFELFLTEYRALRNRSEKLLFPEDLALIYLSLADKFGLPTGYGEEKEFVWSAMSWPAFKDSVDALKRLKKHFHLVAMTNARKWAFDGMDKTLGSPFLRGFTVDDSGCEKPDPQYFTYVLEQLAPEGYTKGDVLHVAQSQFNDIGIARQLGYSVCWIERRKAMGGGFGGTVSVPELTVPDYHYLSLSDLADAADRDELVMLYS
ncbi:HAD-IA family hydrolase [Neokomagataea thailandica]|uniref:Hydrolase n=1 Tax=Neokomagataea tanensis NBRC 106556 TaxID=1223519 RepID=A0ABQ0QIS4_9PROT|nr:MULTISPECIES: HAD-IA family hydrolase [Neokomagataea]GBR46311.1 putative hydrolase [Neokomagataea tanensis NBRC 106556]